MELRLVFSRTPCVRRSSLRIIFGIPFAACVISLCAHAQTSKAVQPQTPNSTEGVSAPAQPPATPSAPAPPALEGGVIRGTVKSGSIPLPGASITATNTLTGKRYATTTDVTGAYQMTIPRNGRYVLRVELAAFAADTKEAVLNAASRQQQADFVLVLASRAAQSADTAEASATIGSVRQGSGRSTQNLSLLGAAAGLIGAGSGESEAQLPSMAGNSDVSTDSVAVSGQNGTTNPFAGAIGDQMRQGFENEQQQQGLSQIPGQQSGGGGFFGGGGSAGAVVVAAAAGVGAFATSNQTSRTGRSSGAAATPRLTRRRMRSQQSPRISPLTARIDLG